jgi:RimJ/RimL family protein N-acetyltransferase
MIIETPRLALRRFTRSDVDLLHALDSDPDVMKFISGGLPGTREQSQAAIERILGYYDRFPVLGLWAAELKESGQFIGWFSLKPLPGTEEIEIGYRLFKRHWGRGYATEGARRMVQRGFAEANLRRVVGITHPDNKASQHVLEKAGLRYERRMDFTSPMDGITRPVDLFAANRE